MKSILTDSELRLSADLDSNEMNKSLLENKPIVEAQFEWRMDLLAGHLLGVSHDTYDLERFAAIKNSWETAREGREEQASAAVNYYIEKRRLHKEQYTSGRSSPDPDRLSPEPGRLSPGGSPTKSSVTGASRSGSPGKSVSRQKSSKKPTMTKKESFIGSVAETVINPDHTIGLLVSALKIDTEVVKRREEILGHLPKYYEFIEPVPKFGSVTLLTNEEIEVAKEARLTDVAESSANAAAAVQSLVSLTETLRVSTRDHITSLVTQGVSNMEEVKQAWLQREKYRAYADAKNAALKYLQERCLQAIETLANEELDGKDKRGKNKSKDTKKKK